MGIKKSKTGPIVITKFNDNKLIQEHVEKLINDGYTMDELIDSVNIVYDNIYKLTNFTVPDTWPSFLYAIKNYEKGKNSNICELTYLARLADDNRIDKNNIISLSCYSLITSKWLDQLASYIGDKKCLEIMCGNGIISAELKKRNIDTTATTMKANDGKYLLNRYWTEDIIDIDAINAIEIYGRKVDYIIMTWPPLNEIAYSCLIKMRQVNPNCKIIYLGEYGEGACCGSKRFFDIAFATLVPELNENLYHWSPWFDDKVYLIQ